MHLPALSRTHLAPGTAGLPLHALLYEAHRVFDEQLATVVDAVDAGVDKVSLVETWTAFDHALRAHLQVEEAWLLPGLEATHGEAIAALREEHEAIRLWLEELDVAVQLHAARAEQLLAFLECLRAHARDEDAGAYRWADGDLDSRAQAALRRALREG